MSNRLAGKRALVTAGGQGMGRAAALAFAREGARVIATDLDPDLLARIAQTPGVETALLDVLKDAEVQAFVAKTGAVDILFNCAGWVHQGTIPDCRVEDWARSSALNVRSMFPLVKAMLPLLSAKAGTVI